MSLQSYAAAINLKYYWGKLMIKFIKNKITRTLCIGAFSMLILSGQALASDECLIAEEHAENGQYAYGHIFDTAVDFL